MTDWREELIEKMAKAAWESDGTTCDMLLETYLTEFRAALAVAEPVIREQCARIAEDQEKYWFAGNLACRDIATAIRKGGKDE